MPFSASTTTRSGGECFHTAHPNIRLCYNLQINQVQPPASGEHVDQRPVQGFSHHSGKLQHEYSKTAIQTRGTNRRLLFPIGCWRLLGDPHLSRNARRCNRGDAGQPEQDELQAQAQDVRAVRGRLHGHTGLYVSRSGTLIIAFFFICLATLTKSAGKQRSTLSKRPLLSSAEFS